MQPAKASDVFVLAPKHSFTLKRGMTSNFELWDWFNLMLANPALRGEAQVVLYANDGETVRARFLLSRCLPVKLKLKV